LGNDPNFATTVLNKLAEKLAKDQNGADIPDPALFVKNLGLGEAAKRNVGTGANQIPDMGSFTLSVSGTGYQKLPSGF
ncbi:phage tail protein, partial [Enterobacter hormaechei subsp. steigerwaltii]|nr:phage tail protein [Enterobacter hormaechei subsp. steigerwaltii]MCC9346265.1 phage tail protein [Enterobacter hormaechei subsp. steigerwaltii]MCC9351336.1 phage tail protein [Enterobacter hormaechei subsp. steigerwaltii]MCC9366594.1 phage tail protein [Enterobacter hormaechei subsp. steigerwaltii]MCC9376302.1 phage tail protein [Enterobacter hormaechei subsp. steigerwaltii]